MIRASPRPSTVSNPSLSPLHVPRVKTCEEVEVGDIGGFGSTEELESHENRCSQSATEFCNSCARNLCSSHYELLHRDHDAVQVHSTSLGLTRL